MSAINAGSYTRRKYEHNQGNGLTCAILLKVATIKREEHKAVQLEPQIGKEKNRTPHLA
jgi:hypothetical protein